MQVYLEVVKEKLLNLKIWLMFTLERVTQLECHDEESSIATVLKTQIVLLDCCLRRFSCSESPTYGTWDSQYTECQKH